MMRNSCFSLKIGLYLLNFQFQVTFYSERLPRASLKCNIWKEFTKLLPCITSGFFLVWCFLDFFRFDAGYPCDRGPVLHIYKREGALSPAQGEPEEPPGTDQPAAAELHETALARWWKIPWRLGTHWLWSKVCWAKLKLVSCCSDTSVNYSWCWKVLIADVWAENKWAAL